MIKVKSTSLDFGKMDREPIDLLIANGCEFESVQVDANSEEQGIAVVKDADVLVVGLQQITERVLDAAGRLKVIGRCGVGLDNIDLQGRRCAGDPGGVYAGRQCPDGGGSHARPDARPRQKDHPGRPDDARSPMEADHGQRCLGKDPGDIRPRPDRCERGQAGEGFRHERRCLRRGSEPAAGQGAGRRIPQQGGYSRHRRTSLPSICRSIRKRGVSSATAS